MLAKLWDKLGEGLAERWMATIFSPAFVFWAGGFFAYADHYGWSSLKQQWRGLSIVGQVAIVVGALLGVLFTGIVVQRGQDIALRLVEGYWPAPLERLRFALASRWAGRIRENYEELQELSKPNRPQDVAKRRRLDAEVARLPVRPANAMPTLLGNLLRAAEEYPGVRYGLDAIVCWSRLYLLLPEATQKEISAARERLNESTRLLAWSVLFLVWTIWRWWALLALLVALLAYQGMVIAAGVYGDLVRAAFDLHRFDLYRKLAWPLPQKPDGEEEHGRQLTEHLFRGVVPDDLVFVMPEEQKKT